MPSSMRGFVLWWNLTYPVDLWWRRKYKVPFNSDIHRSMSMMDIYFEFVEDHLDIKKDSYTPGVGDFLKERKLSESEIEQQFNDIDLDKFPDEWINK